MSSETLLTFNNIQFQLFYSQLTFGLVAARILKSMGLYANRNLNETEEYIIRFVQSELISNTAKIWDKTGLNIERFIDKLSIPDIEKLEIKDAALVIKRKYQQTIDDNINWRHNLGAHLGKDVDTAEKFNEFKGEVSDAQAMIKEVKELIEGLSIFPKDKKVQILGYRKIYSDLNLGK